MGTHSSILSWRLPGTEEPGGLLTMGSHRVKYNWSDLAAPAAVTRKRDLSNEVPILVEWVGILKKKKKCEYIIGDFLSGSDGKESACNAGDLGLVPGLGRSPGEGHGNPSCHGQCQYSYLESPQGQRCLVGYSPWGHQESDATEGLSTKTHSVTFWESRKQPRCPSAEEWIRKLWYIYTMEYYSAIKNNAFESVPVRWMKLEPIIQSEVSQKEKHQYSILTHIYGI